MSEVPLSPATTGPHVFLVAAEESGDRLGAALMRAIKARAARISGIGGHDMAAEGLASPFPISDLTLMGFSAIPRRLFTILRRIRQTADAVIAARPDVLVIVDSPDFTHRVARRVRAAAPQIPIVDYVSPSVWAWRPGRARAMRGYIDHVLALLPFEPQAHARLGGPPCSYVGHPLIERLALLRPNAEEARRRLASPPIVLVLAGSRAGELRRMLGIFAEAVTRLRASLGAFEVVMPTVPNLLVPLRQAVAAWPLPPRIVVEPEQKYAAFRSARAALAKSGTVTLELALAGVPMVTAYKVSAFDAMVARRLIQVPSVVLPNLVLGENAIPELLQEACTAENIASALAPLVQETDARRRQLAALARLDGVMQTASRPPSERAADIVLDIARSGRREGPQAKN